MSNAGHRQELRPHLRDEQVPGDSVIVVRGGPASLATLATHARRTHDALMLDGQSLWGVSVFCALDDIRPSSLDGLLRRFASYRVVHLPRAGQLRAARFELLPSFGRPHFTVRVGDDGPVELGRLFEALGREEPNPYHGRGPGRR